MKGDMLVFGTAVLWEEAEEQREPILGNMALLGLTACMFTAPPMVPIAAISSISFVLYCVRMSFDSS